MEAKKVDKARGKAVKSSDPRKANAVDAFKAAVPGCDKVTMVKERAGGFEAHCMKHGRNAYGSSSYESLGFWRVEPA